REQRGEDDVKRDLRAIERQGADERPSDRLRMELTVDREIDVVEGPKRRFDAVGERVERDEERGDRTRDDAATSRRRVEEDGPKEGRRADRREIAVEVQPIERSDLRGAMKPIGADDPRRGPQQERDRNDTTLTSQRLASA